MDMMRELTDTEFESVTGGQAAAAAAVGAHFAEAVAAFNSRDFRVALPFGGSVTVPFSTAVAFAFAV
jgi:hypothetical protein